MTDLDRLIAAVGAGSIERHDLDAFVPVFGVTTQANDAHMAYRGSLDAAQALHDALIPGWDFWVFRINKRAFSADVQDGENPEFGGRSEASAARAWLIAILKAHRSQVQP